MRYLGLLIFPARQNILHDVPMSRSLIDPPTTLLSFLFLGGLIFFAIRGRAKNPLISYGIAWFFLCLSVESSFITIRHVMFEHRLYLPSIGIFMAVGAMLPVGAQRAVPLRGIFMIIIVIILSVLTVQRNKIWASPVALWEDAHAKSPHLMKPLAQLSMAYLHEENFGKALAASNDALKIYPRHAYLYYNRAIIHQAMGYWQKALEDYSTTLSIDPAYPRALYNRGNIYGEHEQYDSALRDFSAVIAQDPEHWAALNNRGIIYLKMNRSQEALADFDRILARDPAFVNALVNRGNAYRQLKEGPLALADYSRALALDPHEANVYVLRSSLYKELGMPEEARADEQKAVELMMSGEKGKRLFIKSRIPLN